MVTRFQKLPFWYSRSFAGIWLALFTCLGFVTTVQVAKAASPPVQGGGTMQECVNCHAGHGDVELEMTFADGQVISVFVDPGGFAASVHGSTLQCQGCHQEIGGYPHLDRRLVDSQAREPGYLIRKYSTCGGCHPEAYADFLGSAHAKALVAGNGESAICSDCHGVHDIRSTIDPHSSIMRENLLETCQKCHTEATINFPDAWLGHYEPSPFRSPPVYWTEIFFTGLTVLVMAGLIGHIALDVGRTTIDKIQGEYGTDEG